MPSSDNHLQLPRISQAIVNETPHPILLPLVLSNATRTCSRPQLAAMDEILALREEDRRARRRERPPALLGESGDFGRGGEEEELLGGGEGKGGVGGGEGDGDFVAENRERGGRGESAEDQELTGWRKWVGG